jgi:hypothetical protein
VDFEAFQLDHRIESGIEALGYKEPTSIQSQSIPSILQGRDLMGEVAVPGICGHFESGQGVPIIRAVETESPGQRIVIRHMRDWLCR